MGAWERTLSEKPPLKDVPTPEGVTIAAPDELVRPFAIGPDAAAEKIVEMVTGVRHEPRVETPLDRLFGSPEIIDTAALIGATLIIASVLMVIARRLSGAAARREQLRIEHSARCLEYETARSEADALDYECFGLLEQLVLAEQQLDEQYPRRADERARLEAVLDGYRNDADGSIKGRGANRWTGDGPHGPTARPAHDLGYVLGRMARAERAVAAGESDVVSPGHQPVDTSNGRSSRASGYLARIARWAAAAFGGSSTRDGHEAAAKRRFAIVNSTVVAIAGGIGASVDLADQLIKIAGPGRHVIQKATILVPGE